MRAFTALDICSFPASALGMNDRASISREGEGERNRFDSVMSDDQKTWFIAVRSHEVEERRDSLKTDFLTPEKKQEMRFLSVPNLCM